jgi:hypothetical protein
MHHASRGPVTLWNGQPYPGVDRSRHVGVHSRASVGTVPGLEILAELAESAQDDVGNQAGIVSIGI